jgi:GTP cyclohydrolase II
VIDVRPVERAIDALRRGRPIALVGPGGERIDVLAVELAEEDSLAALGPADLLITEERAAALKLVNQRPAARGGPVLIGHAPWIDLATATAVADPVLDLATPLKGPFRTEAVAAPDLAAAALALAKIAGLLPALFVRAAVAGGAPPVDSPAVGAAEVAQYRSADRLRVVSRAHLPVAGAEEARVVAFRGVPEQGEHLALLFGDLDAAVPLVRLHSECLTGDVLGSLKCDCGPQLHAAIHAMSAAAGGVLLYLRQEGRGIGLLNKLRAYALQDQGFDTVDANLRLGFATDERDFTIAARMLSLIGVSRIRLLSNNPEKVLGLQAAGITVVERVPLALPSNPHNADYLATKRDRTGHIL